MQAPFGSGPLAALTHPRRSKARRVARKIPPRSYGDAAKWPACLRLLRWTSCGKARAVW